MKLPQMNDRSIMRPTVRTRFGGLNNNLSAQDGEIVWMENMSSREFPLLRPRQPRGLVQTLTSPNTIGAQDDPFWVDGSGFYYNGTYKGAVDSSTAKQFAVMGSMVLIFPDKKYYDFKAGTFGSLAVGASYTGIAFKSGTYTGVPAEANTIYKSGAAWSFAAGDALTISGCVTHPENNKTAIVREVDGDYLRFYEGTFTLDSTIRYTVGVEGLPAGTYHFEEGGEFTLDTDLLEGDTLTWNGTSIDAVIGGISSTITVTEGDDGDLLVFADIPTDYVESGSVSVAREVPDLDFVCVNENRLWGCKGDTIYASALGDPFNFNVFDGLSTDSWTSDTTDKGDFTACVSFGGYPIFFKEESIVKVQGDKPSNFMWTAVSRFGVKAGCDRSLAVAGETLFYLSRAGICAYQGGMPKVISDPLGASKKWYDAVAGSDGLRYYVSMSETPPPTQKGSEQVFDLYVFDSRYGVWHREDNSAAVGFAFWDEGLYMLLSTGELYRVDGTAGTPETDVEWQVKFADSYRFYETTDSGSQNKKGPLRILIRAELSRYAEIEVNVKYDGGTTHKEATLEGSSSEKKKSYIVPLVLRRCDHYRLSLDGYGDAVVYSISEERYNGSPFQGSSNISLPNKTNPVR